MLMAPQVYRLAGLLALVIVHVPAGPLAAQSTKPPAKKTTTTVQVPKVDVTAVEGTTALAMRGRPSHPSAVKTVSSAFRGALAKSEVRAAVLAEVRRQVRTRRPLAAVDGYWVNAIAMATVYQAPAVLTELTAALGPNAPQLIAAAGAAREGFTITFTPAQLGATLMGEVLKDVLGVARAALNMRMTDVTADNVLFVVTYGLGGLGTGSLVDLARHIMNEGSNAGAPAGNNEDLDGDGIPDSTDADDDGDGYNDDSDHYPRDSSRHICDCGRPAVFLGTAAGTDPLPRIVSLLGAAWTQRSQALSLGSFATGTSGSVVLVF